MCLVRLSDRNMFKLFTFSRSGPLKIDLRGMSWSVFQRSRSRKCEKVLTEYFCQRVWLDSSIDAPSGLSDIREDFRYTPATNRNSPPPLWPKWQKKLFYGVARGFDEESMRESCRRPLSPLGPYQLARGVFEQKFTIFSGVPFLHIGPRSCFGSHCSPRCIENTQYRCNWVL